ncbi:MAG: hypothetical protein JKY42_07230 [Flavobacteriales bacterium]|nr:hypothetical protein [Flavobacteriales bacterium]
MFRKIIISILIILVAYVSFAQDSTIDLPNSEKSANTPTEVYSIEMSKDSVKYTKVMVIPFEPKLYMSDIDREIGKKTGMSATQIKYNFRLGLANTMYSQTIKSTPAIQMYSADNEDIQNDLSYIYKSTGYHYDYMPAMEEKPEESKPKEVLNKIKKRADETLYGSKEQGGTRIKDGQLYSEDYSKERFMNVRILNPNMFDYLSTKYEVGYFVFINQLDMKIAPGTDYRALENEMYQREIKVHYSIYDQYGNLVYASAAKNYFPSVMNDMNLIIKGHFPKICKEIAFHIPKDDLPKVVQKKREEEQKQAAKQEKELDATYNPAQR